jgi:hypothetical protein
MDAPLSESEALKKIKTIMSKNQVKRNFIGMGYYETLTPGVILRNVLENPGWYTAYTPYQAEIAQGRLNSLLNFQTMIADLTGLPLSNSSLLDEATAAAEAMSMCYSLKGQKKKRFFVDVNCHPQNIALCKTRGEHMGLTVEVRVVCVEHASLFALSALYLSAPFPSAIFLLSSCYLSALLSFCFLSTLFPLTLSVLSALFCFLFLLSFCSFSALSICLLSFCPPLPVYYPLQLLLAHSPALTPPPHYPKGWRLPERPRPFLWRVLWRTGSVPRHIRRRGRLERFHRHVPRARRDGDRRHRSHGVCSSQARG